MKIMRNLSAFAALCQRIAMNSLILVILAQKGKLKSQDFIHRNDFFGLCSPDFPPQPKGKDKKLRPHCSSVSKHRSASRPICNRYRTYPYRHADTNR